MKSRDSRGYRDADTAKAKEDEGSGHCFGRLRRPAAGTATRCDAARRGRNGQAGDRLSGSLTACQTRRGPAAARGGQRDRPGEKRAAQRRVCVQQGRIYNKKGAHLPCCEMRGDTPFSAVRTKIRPCYWAHTRRAARGRAAARTRTSRRARVRFPAAAGPLCFVSTTCYCGAVTGGRKAQPDRDAATRHLDRCLRATKSDSLSNPRNSWHEAHGH